MKLEGTRLEGKEGCPDRPFTRAEASLADLEHLNRVIEFLWKVSEPPRGGVLTRFEGNTPEGPSYRLFRLCEELPQKATSVGFFGQIRDDYPREPLMELDNRLIERFPQAKGLLAYASLERSPGQWGNLVLFDSPENREGWSKIDPHESAVDLSPSFYHHVRLHLGRLENRQFQIERTHYLDFDTSPPWRGYRELS